MIQKEEQITVKDILLSIIGVKNKIKKNWLLILLCTIIGGAIGWAYEKYNKGKDTYTSTVKFYLETAAPANELGGLASMFGGGNTGQSNGLFSGTNLEELIKSTEFVERCLLTEVDINGKKEILSNYFNRKTLDSAKIKDIDKSKLYADLKTNNIEKFTPKDYESLITTYWLAYYATELVPEEKSSFMTLNITTTHDTLSKIYSDVFLKTLKEFYLETKNEKLFAAIKSQKKVVDSLTNALNGNENALARYTDQNQEVMLKEGHVLESKLNRKTVQLNSALMEQTRNYQNLKFQSYQDNPFFKIFSPQRLPIIAAGKDITKKLKVGFIVGFFLSLLYILIRDSIREVLKGSSTTN